MLTQCTPMLLHVHHARGSVVTDTTIQRVKFIQLAVSKCQGECWTVQRESVTALKGS